MSRLVMQEKVDKRAFCEDFVARGGEKQVYAHRAQYIKELESQLMDQEKEYTTRLSNQEKAYKEQMLKLTARVAQLQEELDRELEWWPAKGGGTSWRTRRGKRSCGGWPG